MTPVLKPRRILRHLFLWLLFFTVLEAAMATTAASASSSAPVMGDAAVDTSSPRRQEQEDDLASIDRPLVSSANNNRVKSLMNDLDQDIPGREMMLARLTLQDDDDDDDDDDEAQQRAKGTSKDDLEVPAVDSLTTQPPNPRPIIMGETAVTATSTSTGNEAYGAAGHTTTTTPRGHHHAHADAATEASQALQALQTAAAAANNGGRSPVDEQRILELQRKYASGNTMEVLEQQVEAAEEEEIIEEDEDEDEESSEISASDEDGSWISWFCSLRGNEFFCEVDEDYIQDDFNLTGLNGLVPYYDYALDMVLDVEMPMEDSLTEEQQEIVESAAEMLYGLVHARYIVTNRGMHAMYEKYRTASFGRCPHVFCQGQPVLPVGLSDLPRNYTVNVFCPRCHGLFFPKSTRQANIDGAYFGTTFPHLYLMTHPDMVPMKPGQNYVPRVYGFKIHDSSLYYRNHEEGPQQHQIESAQRHGRKSKHRSGRK